MIFFNLLLPDFSSILFKHVEFKQYCVFILTINLHLFLLLNWFGNDPLFPVFILVMTYESTFVLFKCIVLMDLLPCPAVYRSYFYIISTLIFFSLTNLALYIYFSYLLISLKIAHFSSLFPLLLPSINRICTWEYLFCSVMP